MLGNTRFFIGQVENNDDSSLTGKGQGRVQVRVFGVHPPEVEKMPTEVLPWALCIMPNNFGGVSGLGTVPPPQLQKGAWVLGISVDETYNSLIVLGSIVMPYNMADLANAGKFGGTDSLGGMGGNSLMNDTFSSGNCSEALMNMNFAIESSTSYTGLTDAQNRAKTSKGGGILGAGQVGIDYVRDLYQGKGDNTGAYKAFWVAVNQGKVPGLESKAGITQDQFIDLVKNSAAVNKAVSWTYMDYCLRKTGGNPYLCFAAYNQGATGCANFCNWVQQNKGENAQGITDGTKIGNYFREWMQSGGGINAASNREHLAKIAKAFEGNQQMQDCLKQWQEGQAPFVGSTPASLLQLDPNLSQNEKMVQIGKFVEEYAKGKHTHAELQAFMRANGMNPELANSEAWCMEFCQSMYEYTGLKGILPQGDAKWSSENTIIAAKKEGVWVSGPNLTASNLHPMDLVVYNGHGMVITSVTPNPNNPNNPTVTLAEGNIGHSQGKTNATSNTGTRTYTLEQLKVLKPGIGVAQYGAKAAKAAALM